MLKVALFSDTSLNQVNGVAVTLLKMKEYMERKGIEHRFFVPRITTGGEVLGSVIGSRSLDFLLYPECKIALPCYQGIRKELDRFQPDVIHLVTEFSLGLTGLKYGRDNRIPLVGSYHTNIPQYLKYYRAGFLENAAWRYLKWFHSHCAVSFCPSRDTMEELTKRGFENPAVLENGIDTEKFNPVWRGRGVFKKYGIEEGTVLLYVGRLAPEKEIEVLLKAVEVLNRRRVGCRLLIAGDGPARKQIEAKNVPNVVFAGYLTGEELLKVYASADVFAFPSRTETFGNVVMEAMASGLPVVAACGGGVKDSLIDMYNGIAFKPGDSEMMARAVEKLVMDPKLREVLGQNARKHSLTKSWERVFNNLFENYRLVVNEWDWIHGRLTA